VRCGGWWWHCLRTPTTGHSACSAWSAASDGCEVVAWVLGPTCRCWCVCCNAWQRQADAQHCRGSVVGAACHTMRHRGGWACRVAAWQQRKGFCAMDAIVA
jgi:hypothetical protein